MLSLSPFVHVENAWNASDVPSPGLLSREMDIIFTRKREKPLGTFLRMKVLRLARLFAPFVPDKAIGRETFRVRARSVRFYAAKRSVYKNNCLRMHFFA